MDSEHSRGTSNFLDGVLDRLPFESKAFSENNKIEYSVSLFHIFYCFMTLMIVINLQLPSPRVAIKPTHVVKVFLHHT